MSAEAAIAASVAMHVLWNLIARHQPQASSPLWWVLLAHLVLIAPWGLWELARNTDWNARLLGLLALSAVANVVYFQGLAQAYQRGPVALVYPLVRSSPLLIALWGSLFFGQSLSATVWLGIAVSVAGLLALAGSAWRGEHRHALPWTMLAMLATSVYSLSDKAATAHVHSFLGLIGYISVGYAAAWLSMGWQLRRRTGRWTPAQTPHRGALLVGGVCVGTAYALVIHAMREMTAAEVVTYTNAGIVVAGIVSIFGMGERTDWPRRLLASGVVTIGLMIVATG